MSGFNICNFKPGEEITGIYVIHRKKLLPNRNGSGYYLGLTLADKTGRVEARVWEEAEEINSFCKTGSVVEVNGYVTEYNGVIQLNLSSVELCAGEELTSDRFIPSNDITTEEVWEDWLNLAESLNNPHLQQLLTLMAKDKNLMERVAKCPAAKSNHHALLGGLWQHSLGVVAAAEGIAEAYTQVDRDLLVTGALLHDIGKIEEYRCRADIDFTDAGRLLGHIILGIRLVDRYIEQLPDFPEPLRVKLLHMLASHHGEYQWQSPKRPKFLEAAILHQLDMLDALVDMFDSAVEDREEPDNNWTGWVRGLDRYVFCG